MRRIVLVVLMALVAGLAGADAGPRACRARLDGRGAAGDQARRGSQRRRTGRSGSRTAATTRSVGSTRDGMLDRFTADGVNRPWGITIGPDKAVWFTNRGSNAIGRIATSGEIRIFRDRSISDPVGITAGPDGALWFTNYGNDTIGRITTDGQVTSFHGKGIRLPIGITQGPDKALWFASNGANAIGRITTDGKLRDLPAHRDQPSARHHARPRRRALVHQPGLAAVPEAAQEPDRPHHHHRPRHAATRCRTSRGAFAITPGPGKTLWFTEPERTHDRADHDRRRRHHPQARHQARSGSPTRPTARSGSPVQRRTRSGASPPTATSAATPTPAASASIEHPSAITAGPDGALWFTDNCGQLDRADHHRRRRPHATPTRHRLPAGDHGRARTAPSGSPTQSQLDRADHHQRRHPQLHRPAASTGRTEITAGPDGALWFTNFTATRSGGSPPAATIRNYTDPSINGPLGITAGPTAPSGSPTATATRSGGSPPTATIRTYTDPSISDPVGIAAGPDGALWFTNTRLDRADHHRRRRPHVTPTRSIDWPQGITAGPDGALWFAELGQFDRPDHHRRRRSASTATPASIEPAGSRPDPTARSGSPTRQGRQLDRPDHDQRRDPQLPRRGRGLSCARHHNHGRAAVAAHPDARNRPTLEALAAAPDMRGRGSQPLLTETPDPARKRRRAEGASSFRAASVAPVEVARARPEALVRGLLGLRLLVAVRRRRRSRSGRR